MGLKVMISEGEMVLSEECVMDILDLIVEIGTIYRLSNSDINDKVFRKMVRTRTLILNKSGLFQALIEEANCVLSNFKLSETAKREAK